MPFFGLKFVVHVPFLVRNFAMTIFVCKILIRTV